MILNMSGGGGGSGLNFRVLGGTSQPASPKENDIWVNTNTAVHSWDFSATQPCRRSKNKNRLTYPYYHTTMTTNGITFTDNKDGTVTAKGTATAQARFRPFHSTVESGLIWLEAGTYFVSGCPSGGSASTWLWEAFDADNNATLAKDYGNGAKFTLTEGTHVRGSLIIQSGVTVSNQVWKPQIEKGSTATSFVKGDATGQVWISTGASSTVAFDAMKKNGITVYPISAKQYVSGAWVDKTAKSYQNGEWVEWVTNLYNAGKDFTEITGGWESEGLPFQSGTGGNTGTLAPTITWNSDHFIYNGTGDHASYTRSGRLFTVNDVDLTKAKTIRFHILSSTVAGSGTNNTHCWIGVFDRSGAHMGVNKVATVEIATNATEKWYDIDVSALNSSYAVGIEASSQAKNAIELIVDVIYMD